MSDLSTQILRSVSEAPRPPDKKFIAYSVSESLSEGLGVIDGMVEEHLLVEHKAYGVTLLYLTTKGRKHLEALDG